MGVYKHLIIESKVFSLKKWNSVLVSEKSRRVLKEKRLGMTSAHWFAKFLFDCLFGHLKKLYSSIREGIRGAALFQC